MRRGEENTPGRSSPRARPGKRRLFRRGRAGSFPWLRSDKSHACTSGDTQRPEKPPDPTRNKADKKEISNIKIKIKKVKASTHASRAPYSRRLGRTRQGPPLGTSPPGRQRRRPARGRLLCAAGRSESGPRAVAAGARQVVQAARGSSAARTLSCRRRALCTERLPGRRKSTCHFLNCLQLVPLTGPGQAARARRRRGAARPRLRVAGSGALRAASRARALSAAAAAACRSRAACGGGRVCSARSRRWAGSGGVAARRRRG